MAHSIIHLYVHFNMSVICLALLVIKGCPVSVVNLPAQFGMHANLPGCAMGLVVTGQKMSIFMRVTTTSPVCT